MPHLLSGQAKQVNRHDIARPARDVLAIAIGADVPLQPRTLAKAQKFGLGWGNDKARAVQFYAGRADALIGQKRPSLGHINANRQVGIDLADLGIKLEVWRVRIQTRLMGQGQERALMLARPGHRHGNAHGGAVGGDAGPGMVGNG